MYSLGRFVRPTWWLCMAVAVAIFALLAGNGLAADPAEPDVPQDMEKPAIPLLYPGDIRVFNFYWDSEWDADNPGFSMGTIDSLTESLAGSSYFDKLDQYGVPNFFWGGSAKAEDNLCGAKPATTISIVDVAGIIPCIALLPGNNVPLPDFRTIYNVIIPADTTINDSLEVDGKLVFQKISCQDYGAFHVGIAGGNATIIPAACFDSPAKLVSAISHELVEAATDPTPLLYWINTSDVPPGIIGYLSSIPQLLTEGEAADICEAVPQFNDVPFRAGSTDLLVGAYWSNEDNACVVGSHRVVLASFDVNGVGSTGSLTVDGQTQTLPFSGALAEGTSFAFPDLIDGDTGERFVRESDCSGTVDFPAPADSTNPRPVDQVTNITCDYSTEYLLTVATNPASLAVGNASLTAGGWFSDGTIIPLHADAIVSGGAGSRYELTGWNSSGFPLVDPIITMNRPHSVVAEYQLEHQVTFDVVGIPAVVPWHLTVDGVKHTGPVSEWVNDGASTSFQFETPVPDPVDSGIRYVIQSVSTTSPLVVDAPTTVLATYGKEYLLSVTTSGLGDNSTSVSNSGSVLGEASDTLSVTVWLAADTPLALNVDDPVNGTSGVPYFFDQFTPAPPSTMTSPLTLVASYKTMSEQISDALAGGGISGPGSNGVANALLTKFANAESEMAAGAYSDALDDLNAFINQLKAQSGKKVATQLSSDLRLDAAAVYHYAMCQAVAAGQLTPDEHAAAYAYYLNVVVSLGGTPLPDC